MQVSFGRAIRVVFYDNQKENLKNRKQFTHKDIPTFLEDKENSLYNKKTSKKIGDFLRAQFDDYNSRTGMFFWQNRGKTYALTGEEAKKAMGAEKTYRQELAYLDKKYSKKYKEKHPESYSDKCAEANAKKRNTINKMLENGRNGNPYTSLTFSISNRGNLKDIVYYSAEKTDEGCNVTCEMFENGCYTGRS